MEFYLQNGKTRPLTRQHFQLKKPTFARWLSRYHHDGINGLAVLGKKQKYSLEFKLSVIQAVKNGQYSAEQVALHFGIPNSGIISQWLHTFDKQCIEMLLPMVGLKRSTFFYHLAEKSDKNADIVQKVAEIYHENQGNYGYRRITLVLRRIGRINHKKVQVIM